MPHLLQIHIGPVQAFITTARRSRDLWYGSWLLSELSKAAAHKIATLEPAGLDALIFPAPDKIEDLESNSNLNVANKIVAEISGSPRDVAEEARTAVWDHLHDLRKLTFSGPMLAVLESAGTWTAAKDQINDFLEFYWVSVPLEEEYKAAREQADLLLAARKSTRNFKHVTWGSRRPKSSLDGARESVIPEGKIGDVQEMYDLFRAKANEELSGLDLLKRRGKAGTQEYFPSTSHMAALPLSTQLAEIADAASWKHYFDSLPDSAQRQEIIHHNLELPHLGKQDGSLLFASRLLDYSPREDLAAHEEALDKFYKESKIDRPNPYYAVLVGDGDSMGRTINKLTDPAKNRKFSKTLASFAAEARRILHKHQGAAIFTGGDDVLALLPLHTVLQCTAELASNFRSCMAKDDLGGHDPPTFSAGIAIVHHLEPLEDALTLARKAEKAAKEFPDKANPTKNALAVALAKRSGAPRQVVGRWGTLDERLLNMAALHQAQLIPDGLAYQLRDTYQVLGGRTAVANNTDLRAVLKLEAERIIGRKQVAGGGESVADKYKDFLIAAAADSDTGAASLADELIIAGLLAKAAGMAQVDLSFKESAQGGAP